MKKILSTMIFCSLFCVANAADLPDFVPSVQLGGETFEKCLLASVQKHSGDDVELCRNARVQFSNDLEKWIKSTEDAGFITPLYGQTPNAAYPENVQYAIALIDSAQILENFLKAIDEVENMQEDVTDKVVNRFRTGSPLDMKYQSVRPECPSIFPALCNSYEDGEENIAAKYMKLLLRTIRLDLLARNAELKNKKENGNSGKYSFLMMDIALLADQLAKADWKAMHSSTYVFRQTEEVARLEQEFLDIANGKKGSDDIFTQDDMFGQSELDKYFN